jgi:hypothetical protein
MSPEDAGWMPHKFAGFTGCKLHAENAAPCLLHEVFRCSAEGKSSLRRIGHYAISTGHLGMEAKNAFP